MIDLNTFPINITSEISAGVTIESAVYNGARGRSAYEVWIDEGHQGNEKDFLEWLRASDSIASSVTVEDVEDYYTGVNVEEILQEVAIRIEEKKDKYYTHIQGVADAVWTINHNLDKYPSVTIIDSADRVVIGDVLYKDTNTLTVSFAAGFSGKAYLN